MIVSRSERVEALVPDDKALASGVAALPEWRRRKCSAFRFDADRRRSVAVWVLLRQLLAEMGVDADSPAVTENEFGKPAFDPPIGLHFSLSHAGDRVMAVVSDSEVGCDVERIIPIDDGMLKVSLTDAERAWLAEYSGTDRNREFIRLWVRKESYAKAVGKGMEIGLLTFSALETPPSPGWIWRDFDFGDGYLGCVCTSCKN